MILRNEDMFHIRRGGRSSEQGVGIIRFFIVRGGRPVGTWPWPCLGGELRTAAQRGAPEHRGPTTRHHTTRLVRRGWRLGGGGNCGGFSGLDSV